MKKILVSLLLAVMVLFSCSALATAPEVVPEETHEDCPVEWIHKAPTCTETGICHHPRGDVEGDAVDEFDAYIIPALGHEADDTTYWVEIEPTCEEPGLAHADCVRCDYVFDYELDPDTCPFELVCDIEESCVNMGVYHDECFICGQTEYCTVEDCDGTLWDGSACKYHKPIDPLKHKAQGEWVLVKEPTCLVEGQEVRLCSACQDREERAVPALGHDLVVVETVVTLEATCTTTGTAYDVLGCTRCDYTENTEEYETPVQHHYKEHKVGEPVNEATCDRAVAYETMGHYEWDVCRDCEGTFNVIWVQYEYLDHAYGEWVCSVQPEEGVTPGLWIRECEVCGETQDYVGDECGIGNHMDGDVVIENEVAATFTSAGSYDEVVYCLVCGAELSRETVVGDAPVEGLNPDDGIYYEDGAPSTYTGMVSFNGGEFAVTNGVLDTGANGLNLVNGKWVFLAQGQKQTQHTGFALYDGEWFYLVNGDLDTTANGLYQYNGGTFLIAAGRLVKECTGLCEFDGVWYFAVAGQIATDYTGPVTWNGETFNIVNGKLA